MVITQNRRDDEPNWTTSGGRPVTRGLVRSLALCALLVVLLNGLATPAVAATPDQIGDAYCGTSVESGIDFIFGALTGLGLPLTMFYTARAGLGYMRAGGSAERKNRAKEQLVHSVVGFGIIVFALVAPELISKFGEQIGFSFSACVKPF
jgi:hypothetical protein